jgi:glutamine amidotransferase
MQWNLVEAVRPSPILAGIESPLWAYFNHSYVAPPGDDVVATCDYGGPVPAVLERGNVWATQFHPEKSSERGLAVLANFVRVASLHRVS